MKKGISIVCLLIGISLFVRGEGYSAAWTPEAVSRVMKQVADWQIEHFEEVKHRRTDWTNAALYLGMFQWATLAEEKGDSTYFEWLMKIGNRNYWQPGGRMYHADDIAVSQLYLDMYKKYGKKSMIQPTLARTDWVIAHPSQGSFELDYRQPETLERWTWCDALFMAPALYARLYAMRGDKKYIRFMEREFKETYKQLFDEAEDLFYRDRRYLNEKEANGAKVFWGRGNGWVMGGLCQLLEQLPAKSKYRDFYEDLFVRMAERMADLQQADGFWRASLLDPQSYPAPETSGTGFFVYALAYGINQGILPAEKFLPVVEKGWKALISAVEENGKLGYVQPIGADPKKVKREMTEVYGVGAFLLTGCEIYRMCHDRKGSK